MACCLLLLLSSFCLLTQHGRGSKGCRKKKRGRERDKVLFCFVLFGLVWSGEKKRNVVFLVSIRACHFLSSVAHRGLIFPRCDSTLFLESFLVLQATLQ